MADNFYNTLELKTCNASSEFIYIEELHGSDSCFALAAFMEYALKENVNLCLVLLHNSFNHFNSIGLKLGYNLERCRNKGMVRVIELSELVSKYLASNKNGKLSPSLLCEYTMEKLKLLRYESENVYLVIEDISSLLLLSTVKECLQFIKLFQNEMGNNCHLKLLISSHVSKYNNKQIVFSSAIKYMADLIIQTEPLETGFSSEISGQITIIDKDDIVGKTRKYNYKLMDRKIIINHCLIK